MDSKTNTPELTPGERWMSAFSKVVAVFFLGLMLVQMTYYRGNRPNTEPVLVRERVEIIRYDPSEDTLGRRDSSTTLRMWK